MDFMDALVDGFVEAQVQLEEQDKKIKLSSSDGTYLTVSGIKQATGLLRNALQRLEEINDGTYKSDQKPIRFDKDTSPDLLGAVLDAQESVNKLVDFLYG